MTKQIYLLFIILMMSFSACQDTPSVNTDSTLNIRLAKDPEKLSPVFNPSATAREIFQYIFVPLCDFHPESYELTPILIEALPTVVASRPGLIGYKMKFREDAVWSDGKPILGSDYAFTVKAVKHPSTNTRAWKPIVDFIKDVELSADDPRSFTVFIDKDYMLSLELATTIYVYPKHIYDSNDLLKNLSFEQVLDAKKAEELISKDSILQNFATTFNEPKNYREVLVNCGPYQLADKESNQYYVLERKTDYWGSAYPNVPFLQAYPQKIVFKIMPDEMTAMTALKSGNIDVIKLRNSGSFVDLKKDAEHAENFSFFTPELMLSQYIALNNDHPILKDVKVRKALAALIDVEDIINSLDYGLGTQTIGPFHPSKDYYNSKLSPVKYDLERAKKLLAESGWSDLDNDGDLDKSIDGKSQELALDILISGAELGKKVALMFQESAKKAGVKINIVTKDYRLIRKENLYAQNYDMVASISSSDLAPDDPFIYWHSDNSDLGEQNTYSYKNEKSDELIDQIRSTRDATKRKQHYLALQEQLYEDQPVIFMYAPLDKIVVNKNFEAAATSKRPGYLANTFKQK